MAGTGRAAAAACLGLLACACIASAAGMDLHSLAWSLDNAAGSGNVTLEGVALPTTVQQALQAAGVLGDPMYRYGELEYRWVALDNWTLSASFQPPPELLAAPRALLRFGAGLDAASADVALNGARLGTAANAHRPHAWDVTGLLAQGRNELRVTLWSAPAVAAARAAAAPYSIPATQQVGSLPGYNFVRKAASDFGWDWGPAFAPSGIYGPVQLLAYSTASLDSMAVRQQHHANGSVTVEVEAALLPPPPTPGSPGSTGGAMQSAPPVEKGELRLELVGPDGASRWEARQTISIPPAGAEGSSDGSAGCSGSAWEPAPGQAASASAAPPAPAPVCRSLRLLLDAPQLWWPHDLGEQPLYQLRLTYTPGSRADAAGSGSAAPAAEGGGSGSSSGGSSSSLSRRIGLRRVELVTDPLLGGAESFHFSVNGQTLYARGANIVPAHLFEPAVTPAQLHRLVRDAKAAHMNMLRVWGGGRYPQDAFYDACDEQGVLVWQEAMYACALYPADRASLREAWLEVRHQAARLSGRASVALWGGGNEVEAAFEWFAEPRLNARLYAVDYSRQFVDVVRQAVAAADPGWPYVDASPSNGLLSRDPYSKRWGDVASPRFGDVHFYDYSSNAFDPGTYPPAKFVSEFGFMSLPSLAAYKRVTAPEDWSLGAPMTDFRMRHAHGLQEMWAQLRRHFLHQPLQAPPAAGAAAAAGGAAAEPAEPAPQQAGQQRSEGRQQALEEQLARLAAGSAALAGVFDAATAEGRNPVDAVSAAAAAAAAAAASGPPAGEEMGAAQEGPPPPPAEASAEQRFAAATYLTQLQQALAYQTAVHQWRRNRGDARAQTMGVLYWQLQDVWAGPSWSSINADGSWRLLHHFAGEFFRPVLVSGVAERSSGLAGAATDAVAIHLTNDLPVGVTGTLSVDAISFAAQRPEDVVSVYQEGAAFIGAGSSRPAWSGSVAGDVLAAVDRAGSRNSSNGSGGGGGTHPTDVFLRLRFCPTAIEAQQAAGDASSPPPLNPFAPSASRAATAQLALALGGGSSSAEEEQQAAASDGSDAPAACDAPIEPPPGATEAHCAAAQRLLQCSESLFFLTELKDARLQPASVTASVDSSSSSAGAGGAGSDRLIATLASDSVALFVAPEEGRRAGRFNASALLLLPWQPQAVAFVPVESPAAEAPAPAAPSSAAQQPDQQPGAPALRLYWLQRELAVLGEAAMPASGASSGGLSCALLRLALALPICCLLLI